MCLSVFVIVYVCPVCVRACVRAQAECRIMYESCGECSWDCRIKYDC